MHAPRFFVNLRMTTQSRRVLACCSHVSTSPVSGPEDDVVFDVRGGVATIAMQRHRALNALNLSMVEAMLHHHRAWAIEPGLHLVLVKSLNSKAFSVGGDVKAVAASPRLAVAQFRAEYELMHAIDSNPVPQVALIDGVAMGCGAGLAMNGAFRVVTSNCRFAMPETGIGLFPDVGAAFWLTRPHLPPGMGLFLGLTGLEVGAADMLAAGLATHRVRGRDLSRLERALRGLCEARAGSLAGAHKEAAEAAVRALLDSFSGGAAVADSGCGSGSAGGDSPEAAPGFLAARGADIARCFAGPAAGSIEGVLAALRELEGEDGGAGRWAQDTTARLLSRSPTRYEYRGARRRGTACKHCLPVRRSMRT